MRRSTTSLCSTNTVSLLRRAKRVLFLGVWLLLVGVAARPATAQDTSGPPAEAQADTAQAVENLRAFAKLYGYVRYFHPSDAASATDWERFAVHGARQVEGAASRAALKETLEALFRPIAPTVQIYASDGRPPITPAAALPEDTTGLDLVAWQHRGVGLGSRGPYSSIRLHRQTSVSEGPGFGTVVQQVEAAPYRGKQVRLKGAVKTEVSGSGNQAQLWLRVDRPDRQPGFFDNMGNQPVTASEWADYEITGTVAEDAERIAFGGFLHGSGKAWFDDVQLLVRDGDEGEWTPVPLENAGFETGATDEKPTGWGGSAPGYELATTDETADEGERSLVITSADAKQMARPLFGARPEAGEVAEKPLGQGLAARIPLALYSQDDQTLRPEGAPPPDSLQAALEAIKLDSLTAEDEALRYADVVIAWNIFQHFYPYFDVVEVDWDDALTQTLHRAQDDRTSEDFLQTLQWMVAQLDDGHGRVHHTVAEEEASLPFMVNEIEGEVVIVAAPDSLGEEACVERGDVVASIDGVPSEQALQEAERYLSGSPQWKAYRAQREFGRGERGTQVALTLDRSGEAVTCEVARNLDGRAAWMLQEERPDSIEEIQEGVYYVDLGRAEMGAIEGEAQALAEARGVIFDLRGYPNGNHGVLQYLSEDTLRSAHWQVPQQIYPDQADLVGYDTTGRWALEPKAPHFQGQIVFLTDGRAISYAESIMGIVEHYKLGEIVGQPTAGANGNVNPFTLPGGYRFAWTGMRVVKHDGSQHHLVGIQPTVPVERTLEGVQAGRDEFLEKALELIGPSEEE